MSFRICICCGEHMGAGENALFQNPNLCGACFDLADEIAAQNARGNAETNLSSLSNLIPHLLAYGKDSPADRRRN